LPLNTAIAESTATDVMHPLCVDLDGTLVKSDTLFDSFCQLLRSNPLEAWKAPLWLAKGRANLKNQVNRRAPLDAARLPYNASLLTYLHAQRREGRPIYLTTGAEGSLAERVAGHLGIFHGVLASDGVTNLTHNRKLSSLKTRFGQFDYVGNSRADLPLLLNAREAMVANPTFGLRFSLRLQQIPIARTFTDQRPTLKTLFRAIRIHQWAKNVLLFAPLLLSHELAAGPLAKAVAAFFCFSFMASANYLVNDMLDIESDRQHPTKSGRPFAAGDLPVSAGVALAIVLVLASFALLPMLPGAFAVWLGVYILSTMAYSFYLKRIAIVDVIILSGLYTVRLLAGGAATTTPISQWLAGFSTFLFLSLATVKRFSELENIRERGATMMPGRGYSVADLEQVRSFGTSSAYASVVVFMLYIGRSDVTGLYHHAMRLWLIAPLLIYWLNRVWLLASRGEMEDDPVVFAMRDPMSLAVGIAVAFIAVLSA
jgi:4-hydroxybenzoate polyprenyltransferase